jgi:hypothetical protein
MTSAGYVGIGVTNPAYAVDISGDLNFTGTFRQNGSPYLGSQWTGTSTLYFVGNVGIGTTDATYPLIVKGTGTSTAAPYSNLAYKVDGWAQAYEPTAATTIKIYTDGKIGCSEIDVFSDRRIKKDIQDLDPTTSLEIVKRLRVREYNYVDSVEHGSKKYKGLVAQEVREVVDEAVSTHNGTIPDIFQVPVSFNGRVAQFQSKIESVSIGDSVRVLDEDVERILTVVNVSDFEIEFSEELMGPRIFVYGRKVNDLHTVSYDRLVPILISAVQELAKKLERS